MRRLLILVVLGAVGCGPPAIETLCEDAARAQCAQCFSCGDLDGADLCRTAGSEDDCVETLASSCADQAATLESPKGAIQDCTDSLEELTCDTLVGAMTQDVSYTTAECGYFL